MTLQSRIVWPLVTLAFTFATGAFAVWYGGSYGFSFSLGVFTITGLCVLAVTWSVKVHGDALSPLTLSAVFYFLTFAAGAVYFWFQPALPGFNARPLGDRDHLPVAVWIAATSWALFIAGYIGNPLRAVGPRIPPMPKLTAVRSPWTVLAVLLTIGWCARVLLISQGLYFHTAVEVEESGGATWFIRAFSTVPLLAIAFAGAYGYLGQRRGGKAVRRAFWVLFAVEVVYSTPTAERGMLVALALIVACVRYYGTGGRIPWRGLLASGVVLLLFVFPFIEAYRATGYQNSPTQHLNRAQERTFTGQGLGDMADRGFDAAMQRFNGVTSLVMMSYSDRNWYTRDAGETLSWIPFGFIPRAVFPEKIDPGLFGNEFGRSHGIIASDDYITAITPLQNGELYINFGWLGVLFGMPLAGGLYRLFGEYLRQRRSQPGVLAVYAVLAWPLISAHEAILAVGAVGIVKTMLVYALVLYGVRRFAEAPAGAFVPAAMRAAAR